ncbi:MAG: ArsR family transcriptional regulator [Candidatus Omnitrophota bacterium]|jgi:hypothetical protein|nr:MAG: ArsR family transcriptional regulator [Candidatus Omnitrophota bacterium]
MNEIHLRIIIVYVILQLVNLTSGFAASPAITNNQIVVGKVQSTNQPLHDVNDVHHTDASKEPFLAEIMKNLGYNESVIAKPLAVGLFKSSINPSVTILQKNGNAKVSFGWYREERDVQFINTIFEPVTGPTSAKTINPGDASFGFFIRVDFSGEYQWYTEIVKNDWEAHVKVYPLMKEGKEISDSYLLCWEDIPLGMDVRDDYQDIIVQVTGVTPVDAQPFDDLYGDFPILTFHTWGSTPFSSSLNDNPIHQRILFSVRIHPKSAVEIAEEIKISTKKVTTVLSQLAQYDLVRKTEDLKWVANIPIYTADEILKSNQIGLKYARIEADILREQIPGLKQTYEQCQVSKYHSWTKISLMIVGALCADFCVSDRIRFKPEYFDERFLPPLHPDGSRWGYSGQEVLSSPIPFRKYQFYQNVFRDAEGGIARFGYFDLTDEERTSPPTRPESLRYENKGKIWLSLTMPSTLDEIQIKTGLSRDVVQSAINEMSGWNPPGLIRKDDQYLSSIPIFTEHDLELLLRKTDRIAEIIFKQVSIPMEKEMEAEGKKLGLRYPLSSGTSARDIALQILIEEELLTTAPPPVPWNFGVWGWNGELKMWEERKAEG